MNKVDLYKWSRENWNKIPELVRQDCINELRDKIPADILHLWKTDVKLGREIGATYLGFHFGLGMAVRNVLRNQLTDEELPPIKQLHLDGQPEARNWDDFYMGALQEFVEQELAKDTSKG